MRKVLLGVIVIFASAVMHAAVLTNAGLVLTTNGAGKIDSVVHNGTEYYQLGDFVSDWGISLDPGGPFHFSPGGVEVGGALTISATGDVADGAGDILSWSRTYSLPSPDLLQVDFTIAASSNTVLLKYFGTYDPDQGVPGTGDFRTFNDIAGGDATSKSVNSLSVKYYGSCTAGCGGFTGMTLTYTPDSLGIFDQATLDALFAAPYDPNGALEDIGVGIIFAGALAPGGSISFQYFHEFVPEPSTYLLMGVGTIAVALVRRRRKA